MPPAGRHRRQQVKQPYHVMIKAVGPVCNLQCDYCYYLDKTGLYPQGERFRMDEGMLETFVRDYIRSQPGPEVVFPWHGGEPTLLGLDFFRRAVELQRKYLPRGWSCHNVPQTNGTLLTDAWARFFKAHGFVPGISIDGPEALHDACRRDRRGRPSHARALRGLRLLQAHGVRHSVLCTVNRHNVEHPLAVYRFFRAEGVTALQFLPIANHAGDGTATPESVPAAAFGEFLCAIFDEWLRKDIGRVWVQTFEEALRACRGQPATLCLFAETCGASLAMEHNGDLYACDHFVTEAHRLGNIGEHSLKALVESPAMRAFAQAKRDTLPGRCRACDVLAMCNGGCPKDRFATTPDGEPGLNTLCEGYRRFFRHARTRLEPYLRAMGLGAEGESSRAEKAGTGAVGRNAPCPCGSGRKYKLCCMPRERRRH